MDRNDEAQILAMIDSVITARVSAIQALAHAAGNPVHIIDARKQAMYDVEMGLLYALKPISVEDFKE